MTVKIEKVSSDDQKEVDVRKWANLTAGEPHVEDHFIREFNFENSAQPGGKRIYATYKLGATTTPGQYYLSCSARGEALHKVKS